MKQDNQKPGIGSKIARILVVGAPYLAILTILFGVRKFCFEREKEASARYLNIIRDLGNDSNSVRSGAVITMGAYLRSDENFEKYKEQGIYVLVNHLADEKDPLVIATIQDVLVNISVGDKDDIVVRRLAHTNRCLWSSEKKKIENEHVLLQPGLVSGNLQSIADTMIKIFQQKKYVPSNLDLSKVYLTRAELSDDYSVKGVEFINVILEDAFLVQMNLKGVVMKGKCILNRASLDAAILTQEAKLAGAELKEAHLGGAYLEGAGLEGADLEGADLEGARLKGANLKGANLKGANLTFASLEHAKLPEANLVGADLPDANLEGANLTGANLAHAKLPRAIFKGAILKGAVLFRTDPNDFQSHLDKGTISKGLQHKFENNGIQLANNASLLIQEKGTKYLILSNGNKYRISKEQENLNIYTDTTLEKATLESADLRDADLTNANLVDATLTDANMVNANLQGADLFGVDLTNANLAGANLKGAILESANLAGANLKGAILESAHFAGANLKGAILESVILAGANLEGADLRAALLFGIDPNKFQSDLDEGAISDDLQQEFEDNEISLSKNTTVLIEDENRRWLINDKYNEQTYTVRKEERLNVCTEPKIVETELFGIDSKLQSDLDKCAISEDLRQEFGNKGIYLSKYTTSTKVEDKEWMINDKDNEQTFTVRKEDGQLKIYEKTKLDPTELFSIYSKKFKKDLDDVTISKDLRQEFENNGISLSQNTTVSIKVKDKEWLINDKDNEQTYTIREEWLNICKETKFDLADIKKKAINWQKAIFDDDVKQK